MLSQDHSIGVAATFETGNLHIEVVQGDILAETTDAIVNSIGPHLNFDKAGKCLSIKSFQKIKLYSAVFSCESHTYIDFFICLHSLQRKMLLNSNGNVNTCICNTQ